MSVEAIIGVISFAASAIAVWGWVAGVWHRYLRRRLVRRFFGGSTLTVYLPLRDMDGRTVVDEADFQAAVHLVDKVIRDTTSTTFEFVSADGAVDLSSAGLVVICGPKTSADVASAVKNDPNLQFVEDSGDYALEERKGRRAFRSPIDFGQSDGDIGYIARSTRRTGVTETFISIAGIHSPGSAGIVHWLSNTRNLRKLHRQTRGRLFSAVIECEVSRNPFRVSASRLLALYVGAKPVMGPRQGVVTSGVGEAAPQDTHDP